MPRAAKTAATPATPAKATAKAATKTTKAATASKAAATSATKKAAATKQVTTSKTAAKSAAKTTAKKAAGGDNKFFEAQRKALLEERETYTRQAQTLRAEAEALAEDMEPGDVQFDEESGEGDTINVERERDLQLSAQALQSVEEIDRALAKIDDGSYGICEQCGEQIPKERLKALPYAALCVRCKSAGLSTRR
jgi:RNA polymerase-binding protein DksA